MLNSPLHIGIFFKNSIQPQVFGLRMVSDNWSRISVCSEVVDYPHNVCTIIVPVDLSFQAVFIVACSIHRWVSLLIDFLHQQSSYYLPANESYPILMKLPGQQHPPFSMFIDSTRPLPTFKTIKFYLPADYPSSVIYSMGVEPCFACYGKPSRQKW